MMFGKQNKLDLYRSNSEGLLILLLLHSGVASPSPVRYRFEATQKYTIKNGQVEETTGTAFCEVNNCQPVIALPLTQVWCPDGETPTHMALCFTFQQTGKYRTQWFKENFGCPWASCVMNWMVEGHSGDSHHMLTFQRWAPRANRYLNPFIKDPLHNHWNEGITGGVYLNNFQAYPCQTIMIRQYLEVSTPKHFKEVQQGH